MRMGQPADAAALRPRIRAGVMLLLENGLVIDFLDALRQVDPAELADCPARAAQQPGAVGGDRQQPEPPRRIDDRK